MGVSERTGKIFNAEAANKLFPWGGQHDLPNVKLTATETFTLLACASSLLSEDHTVTKDTGRLRQW